MTRPPARARALLCVLLATVLAATSACRGRPPGAIQVAAAADLTAAAEQLGPAFERETGRAVRFTFGSSGMLARQIAEGAPFDAFLSASPSYVDTVIARGACVRGSRAGYARGRLALVIHPSVAGAQIATLAALAGPAVRKIAIANPEHAPYGVAAREALADAGALEAVTPRLVLAENARQALQMLESGNVEAALVPWSLVRTRTPPAILVAAAAHQPIEQTLVACTRGRDAEGGAEFAAFLRSETASAILRDHGFDPPAR